MSELTRCLCGGNAGHIQREAGMMGTMGYDRWHAVRCQSCGLTLGESDRRFRSKAEAGKAWNALMSKAAQDTEALNWIERQHLEELGMGLVIDAPNDGQYYVCGDSGTTHYGKTLREALAGAMKEEI